MDENTLKHVAAQLRKPEGDSGRQMGETMNKGNRYINEWTIEVLQPQPGDKILEIGMGNGFFVKDILSVDPSIRYTGCDFSELMVQEAIEKNKEYIDKGQARFVSGVADKLPFEDASFHKVFTVNTIYFWEDRKKVLSEFRRVLKPGGILIIALRPKEEMQHYPMVKYGFNLFTDEEVADLLFESGFTPLTATEREEPDQEIAGQKLKVKSLIVVAEKSE